MTKKHFKDFNLHLTGDGIPSEYFDSLMSSGNFPDEYPFEMLLRLNSIPQSPVHHPEGSVWKHTMMVVDNAARMIQLSRSPRCLMWAALLHDLGKIPSTKVRNGRITAYDHDIEGEKLTRGFLLACTDDASFIEEVCSLVRWHMQALYVEKRLPYASIEKMKAQADVREVALLSVCDRLGRGGLDKNSAEKEVRNIKNFLRKCGYDSNEFIMPKEK